MLYAPQPDGRELLRSNLSPIPSVICFLFSEMLFGAFLTFITQTAVFPL